MFVLFIHSKHILTGTKIIKMRYNFYLPIVKNLVLYRYLLSLNSVEHLKIIKVIANIFEHYQLQMSETQLKLVALD